MDINRITIALNNVGGLDSYSNNTSSWDGWGYFPYYSPMIFDHELWIFGIRQGAVGCLSYPWRSAFSPGPVINGQPAMRVNPQDSARYRVYEIVRGDSEATNLDVARWPSDFGAPVDQNRKPRVLGDQMCWMVYNGLDSTAQPAWFRHTLPVRAQLPVEIHETVFAHFGEANDTSIWANTLFFEWAVYNRGPDPIDSMYLAFWTDLDFVSASQNVPAVDTNFQVGYCWYGSDSTFASVGYELLYGPAAPSSGDTAVFFGLPRAGYQNLPLSSFWGIRDDSYPDSSSQGPPYSDGTAWNLARGLSQRGTPIVDPTTNQPTRFPFSGDPITGTGYVAPYRWTGGGAGFMMTTGCFTLAPGDSQWVMVAVIPSVRLNGIDAINRMRMNARYLRSLPYDSLVTPKSRRSIPIPPLPTFKSPSPFALFQNYPNPFNSWTVISLQLPERSLVEVQVFDILGRIVSHMPNRLMERGKQNIFWRTASPSGVYYVQVLVVSEESSQSWRAIQKAMIMK